MYYLKFKLNKEVEVCGKKLLNIFYNLFNIIYWISIFSLVLYESGHISKTKSFKSTTNLKIKEIVFTNFTEEDFEPNLFKPELLEQFNRLWDSVDYSFSEPDEIQVITNLVITPNQTRSTCPESPYMRGILCKPDNNHCVKGRINKHGILTGMCVPCNIKYHEDENDPWTDRYCCEIEKGWCPVEYFLPPLKNYTAALKHTKNSNLWLRNIVAFNEYDIKLDNQIDPNLTYYLNCRYDPQRDTNCPVFKLETILKLSKHNNQDYDTMAKFGAVININITYECFYPFWLQIFKNLLIFELPFVPNIPFINVRSFDQRIDCQIKYEFSRIDNEDRPPATGYTSYRQIFLYNQGKIRTHWLTYRLRITVDALASLGYYDPFKFFTIFFAYHGLYSFLNLLISAHVRKMLANHSNRHKVNDKIVFDKYVQGQQTEIRNEIREINETTPLRTRSSLNKCASHGSLNSKESLELTEMNGIYLK